MSSSFGKLYRIHSFGESHGPAVGLVIDGCPAGLSLDPARIEKQLRRRRPGQSSFVSQRKEEDQCSILSGLYQGKSLGSPISIVVHNTDLKSKDYESWHDIYRPSHADYSYHAKYAWRTPHGGGRASARESIARVAGGAVAAQILEEELGIQTIAWVDSVGDIKADLLASPPKSQEEVDASALRCPDLQKSKEMIQLIEEVRKAGDSIGGTIGLVVWNAPPGLGEPVFGKLEAELARACLSIPACKGFESGSGFLGTQMKGSTHNDAFFPAPSPAKQNKSTKFSSIASAKTRSNHSGGIQGGISNGMPIQIRLAFKPTASIFHSQESINESGQHVQLKLKGRHDPCVLPRAVPIVEAMVNLVLVDAYLLQRARQPEWYEQHRSGKS